MIETAGEPLKVQAAAAGETAVHKVRSVRAVGTRAVLAELSGTQDVLALQALLLEHPLPGQLDILAAAETVLVTGRFAGLGPADRRPADPARPHRPRPAGR